MFAEPVIGIFVGIAGGLPLVSGIINHNPWQIVIGTSIIVAFLFWINRRRKEIYGKKQGEKRDAN